MGYFVCKNINMIIIPSWPGQIGMPKLPFEGHKSHSDDGFCNPGEPQVLKTSARMCVYI